MFTSDQIQTLLDTDPNEALSTLQREAEDVTVAVPHESAPGAKALAFRSANHMVKVTVVEVAKISDDESMCGLVAEGWDHETEAEAVDHMNHERQGFLLAQVTKNQSMN